MKKEEKRISSELMRLRIKERATNENGTIDLLKAFDELEEIYKERGFEVGVRLERERNIRILIEFCEDFSVPYKDTKNYIKMTYDLKKKKAKAYMKKYWKGESMCQMQ